MDVLNIYVAVPNISNIFMGVLCCSCGCLYLREKNYGCLQLGRIREKNYGCPQYSQYFFVLMRWAHPDEDGMRGWVRRVTQERASRRSGSKAFLMIHG